MKRKMILAAAAAVLMGLTQAAPASFCPFGKSKKASRPPLMRPAYPVMAWAPVQPVAGAAPLLQPVYLVPVYRIPARPMPAPARYYGYR